MADIKRIGDSGVHNVEGNVAGARAARLTKQRDKEKAEYEAHKNKIKEENAASMGKIDEKFNAATDSLEQEFRRKTVGLVTLDDFRKAREAADVAEDAESIVKSHTSKLKAEEEKRKKKKNDQMKKQKKMAASLSFEDDDGDDVVAQTSPELKRSKKNPDVDTFHLPDRDRDEAAAMERQRLTSVWMEEQERIKNEVCAFERVLYVLCIVNICF